MISTRALQESPHRLGIILSSGKYSLCRSRHNEYLYAFPGGALFQPVYKGLRTDKNSQEERSHEDRAQELTEEKLRPEVKEDEDRARRRLFVLQIVQPGLAGLMDGSVSTLAPVFAAALATKNSWDAFLVGMAASLGAGISMGFAEALSDDGSLTGRGHPWVRGLICGAMTTLGGIGHTLPFLINQFQFALGIAFVVVLVELGVITWVRHRFMDTPVFSAALQVGLGGALVFITGVLIGRS